MPTTRTVARNEMFQQLFGAKNGVKGLLGLTAVYEQRWQGVETPDEVSEAAKQMQGKFWTRAVIQTIDSFQSAHMMTDEPGGSPAQWTTVGQIIVQFFAPRNVVNSFALGDVASDYVAKLYRNLETPSGVWFKASKAVEVAPEHSFWRWNIFADFEYYERQVSEGELIEDFFSSNNLTVGGSGDGIGIFGNELRVDIESLPNG